MRLIVRLASVESNGSACSGAPGLSLVGELRNAQVAQGGVTLMLGDVEGSAGGAVRLPSRGLSEATLTTFDGNDFFIFRLRWPGLELIIQDEASGAV